MSPSSFPLFDTHTHFDIPQFDESRHRLAELAYQAGVLQLVLVGYRADLFNQLLSAAIELNEHSMVTAHLAAGLHPVYIAHHDAQSLIQLDTFLMQYNCVALGEIGLDTYVEAIKTPELYARQQKLFAEQLALATAHHKPVILHIRRAHGDALKLIKSVGVPYGGIVHSFSGGIEEARAYIHLGLKLGINGMISSENAKKLRTVVRAIYAQYGAAYFVIETDCPDMMPQQARTIDGVQVNHPANLRYVFESLWQVCDISLEKKAEFASQIWHNSQASLRLNNTQ